MARTDKDRPYWVRAADSTENRVQHHQHHSWRGGTRDCDFKENEYARPSRSYSNNCGWILWSPNYWYTTSVPKWFIDHVSNNPERVRVRDDLRNMAREYNAHNDIEDDDFPNNQHHHGASWWYW